MLVLGFGARLLPGSRLITRTGCSWSVSTTTCPLAQDALRAGVLWSKLSFADSTARSGCACLGLRPRPRRLGCGKGFRSRITSTSSSSRPGWMAFPLPLSDGPTDNILPLASSPSMINAGTSNESSFLSRRVAGRALSRVLVTLECSLVEWLDRSDKRDLLAGRPASMSKPPTWAVESARELRRLSALTSEGAVELVAALDAVLVVMCSGVVGCKRDALLAAGALLELRLDRRAPVSGDVAGRRKKIISWRTEKRRE